MKVVAFIESPQGDVIEKILQHCGLWNPASPRAPPSAAALVYVPDADGDGQTAGFDQSGELTYVPDADWDSQTASLDEPWEADQFDADPFEAAF